MPPNPPKPESVRALAYQIRDLVRAHPQRERVKETVNACIQQLHTIADIDERSDKV